MRDPGTLPGGHRVPLPRAWWQHSGAQPARAATEQGPGKPGEAAVHIVAGKPADTAAKTVAASAPAASPDPSRAPSLLDHPPQPAQVSLSDGHLVVHANNSSLTQILHDLASTSGMKINGLGKDQRVFGTYGPGDPRDILSDLLNGTGYNVLMLGDTADGAPRELILSARSNTPAPSATGNSGPQQQEQDTPAPQNNNNDNSTPPEPPPPSATPFPTPQMPPGSNGQVKSPQQFLQEMQQMRGAQQPQQ